jgi:hypothetical protein
MRTKGRDSGGRRSYTALLIIFFLLFCIAYQGFYCGGGLSTESNDSAPEQQKLSTKPFPRGHPAMARHLKQEQQAEAAKPVVEVPSSPPKLPHEALQVPKDALPIPPIEGEARLIEVSKENARAESVRRAEEEARAKAAQLPTPAPPKTPWRAGDMWLFEQSKNELNWVRNILAEKFDWMRKSRVNEREETRKERENPTTVPKKINCRCHGLSAMDPRGNWCSEQNGKDTKVSPSHVCVAQNVCIDRGGKLIFVSEQEAPSPDTERSSFSISLANSINLPADIVYKPHPQRANKDYYREFTKPEAYARGLDYDEGASSPSGKKAPYGTLVMLGHSAAVHITHFLEPVGSLQVGVRDLMVHDSQTGHCPEDDLTCFNKPTLTVSNAVSLDNGALWGSDVLRIVYQDYDRKMSFRKADSLQWNEGENHKCFKKAVIPGAFYGIWPIGTDTTSFHDSLKGYLEKHRAAANLTAPPAKSRTILIAHRTSKRTIVDNDNFVRIVTEHAEKYGAKVNVVMFGTKNFLEQSALAEEAGILMGIHGADLTNMIFQKRGSVVIEINPLFFFENRFFEMALALGHKYMPWNCGTHECAFGGDRGRFDGYIQSHSSGGLKYDHGTYSYTTNLDPEPFEWNWKGYIGYACPKCDRIICCTGVNAGFYGELRESSVKIGNGRHADEIRSVLDDAFAHLKWERVDDEKKQ